MPRIRCPVGHFAGGGGGGGGGGTPLSSLHSAYYLHRAETGYEAIAIIIIISNCVCNKNNIPILCSVGCSTKQ